MRILDRGQVDASTTQLGKTLETARADQVSSGRRGAARESGSTDRVEVSSLAGRLALAMSVSVAERSNRVAALSEMYSSGRYQGDPAVVAGAMVSESLVSGTGL